MIDWKKMKSDISRGLKDGADTVAKKAEEISTESQRKLKIFNLKKQIRDKIEDLGAEIYNAEKMQAGAINHEGSKNMFKEIEVISAELKTLEKE